MLSEALSFSGRDDDWFLTILIGGVLSFLGFLVIPAILVNGYLLRVVRAAVEGDQTPPRFSDWGDLFVDGLLVWVVGFVYVGVPMMVLGVWIAAFFAVATVTTGAPPDPAPAVGPAALVGLLGLLAAGGFLLVAVYLLPAALANFARTDDVVAAFHLRTVARAAFTVDYLLAVVLVVVVSVVLGFVGGLLTVVLVGVFVLFYLQVVVAHIVGQGFARGLGLAAAA